MKAHLVALFFGFISVGAIVVMLRRNMKEKYAVLWLLVGLAMLVLAIWPPLLDSSARMLGIKSGPNLLLFLAVLVLVTVCVHISWEVSRLEDRNRALAEEIGLLRFEFERTARPLADDVTG